MRVLSGVESLNLTIHVLGGIYASKLCGVLGFREDRLRYN